MRFATQLSVHRHAISSNKAPVMEDSVLHMDAHCSQARMQSTFFHIIPIVERRLPYIVLGSGARRLLGQKTVRQRVVGKQTKRQRDEQRIFRLARNARQVLLAANLQDLVHSTDPALRPATISCADNLMHSSQGDTCMATRLCTVLSKLLTPAIFLKVHSECWCASVSLAANLSANSVPAHPEWLMP